MSRQPNQLESHSEQQNPKAVLMPNQNKYSFMGVSSVKQSSQNLVAQSHTAGPTQDKEYVSFSNPGSNNGEP